MPKDIFIKSVELKNKEIMGYRECGNGNRTILLVHGNMTSSKHWDLVLENIPEDYKIYAIDLRGFGMSSYNTPIDSIKNFSDDIKLFIEALNIRNFTLVGWSLGGCVAMQFVVDYPGYASKLILMDSGSPKGFPMKKRDIFRRPTGKMLTTKKEIAYAIRYMLSAYKFNNRFLLKSMFTTGIYNVNKPSISKFNEYIDDTLTQRNLLDVTYALSYFNISNEHNKVVEGTGEIEKLYIPVLIIHGDKDKVVPLYIAMKTKEMIGDNAELVVLQNCGHSPIIDKLDELIRLILEFTDRIYL